MPRPCRQAAAFILSFIAILVFLLLCAALRAQAPEAAWGYDVPPVVGMTGAGCPGIILATGTVDAADHQLVEGYFAIGEMTILANPKGIPWAQLKSLLGREQELVIRPRTCRELRRVDR